MKTKRITKKFISILLSTVLLLSVFTFAPFTVSAATIESELVGGGIQDKLSAISSVYPTNSYFTTKGTVCNSNMD